MSVKAPATVVANSWSGFYFGGNFGYGRKDPTVTFSPNDPFMAAIFAGTVGISGNQPLATSLDFNIKGATGGLQAGYNWQFHPSLVVGVEADFNFSAIKGDGSVSSLYEAGGMVNIIVPETITASQEVKWYSTVRVRLGWLAANNLLFFGTGGFAFGRIDEAVNLSFNLR